MKKGCLLVPACVVAISVLLALGLIFPASRSQPLPGIAETLASLPEAERASLQAACGLAGIDPQALRVLGGGSEYLFVDERNRASLYVREGHLRGLCLRGARFAAVPDFKGLSALEALWLQDGALPGWPDLRALSALAELRLDGQPLGDPVTGLPARLEVLGLSRTRVTALAPLAALSKPRRLDLADTAVTDFSPLLPLQLENREAARQPDADRSDRARRLPLPGPATRRDAAHGPALPGHAGRALSEPGGGMLRPSKRRSPMVLDWLGGAQDPAQLIAKGKHAKAVEVLRAQLARAAGDQRLRLMLADALAGAGRVDDAVPVLLELADDLAASGQAAKAIATLKKVEKLAPRRRDVDVKLAQLINQKNRPAAKWTPVEYESAGSVFSEDHFKAQETDYSPEARIAAAKGATWVPDTGQAAPRSEAPPVPEEEPAIEILPDDAIRAEEDFRGQILSVFQEALHAPAPPAPAAPPPSTEFKESPLFSSFSADELVAVIRGLVLLSFEPGDIVLTEGDPGDSLFVLTTGSVKAFVHLPGGGQKLVRRMGEGDFFGEISILSGKPRTATVTAATHCELLELDRETLDGICKDHPNVRQVLEDFYVARASGSPS